MTLFLASGVPATFVVVAVVAAFLIGVIVGGLAIGAAYEESAGVESGYEPTSPV